jgi:hypothetical protein
MSTTISLWYDKTLAYGRYFVVLIFLGTSFSSPAQTSVPAMNDYIGDQGKFLDQESEMVLNDLLAALYNEKGYKIYIVSVPKEFCNYSKEDAKIILESIAKNSTEKSMLLYVCDSETGYPVFQEYHGAGWSKKFDKSFFEKLNANVVQPFNERYMTGNGMIVAVKTIQDVQFKDSDIDFSDLKKSLQEAPVDARQLSQTDSGRFGKTDGSDYGIRVFVFILFSIILGIGAVYSVRTRGIAAWFLFIFMLPFWLIFYSIVLGDNGWMMAIIYVAGFLGGRVMVANNNWWFEQRTVLRSSGAFVPPPPVITETRRRISGKKFEGKGSRGSWEQDYE